MKYLLLAMLVLAGCAKDPVSSSRTDNAEVGLDKLFTHDGCSVYRFYDAGHFHYWADCRGTVSTAYVQNCGKNCTRTVRDELQTVLP